MTDFTQAETLSLAQLKDLVVDIEVAVGGSPAGRMTAELWPEAAPETVRNFVRYAAEGFYDGRGFHRVIQNFMIQGGCPEGTGTGSGPRGNIPGEFSRDSSRSHKRGVLSMARSADPNSASCQFFICHGDAAFLDGQYASFGQLIDGDDALDAVAGVTTGGGGENSTPLEKCEITKMSVRPRSEA
ncbi:MAG: peptidylprolyl isomerase [Planctomycetes bacterium]|nr:peptidylprolyl isomerase [Planctomycetota bacterium]